MLEIGERLEHGRARVAHCVTGRWRNVSHYCRPLRLIYVFWAQRSTVRCADSTRCIQTRVYNTRGKYTVRHWTSREASLRHSSGWGDLKRFPSVSWFAQPWVRTFSSKFSPPPRRLSQETGVSKITAFRAAVTSPCTLCKSTLPSTCARRKSRTLKAQ